MDHTSSLDYMQVRDEFLKMMVEKIELTTNSTKCSEEMVWDVLGLASVTRSSIHASCAELEKAPTGEGVRYQLRKGWLNRRELNELEEELNELLVGRLPKSIIGRSHPVAMDLTFIPYHGEAQDRAEEVRRGKAKSGTTHFHAYASAYIIRKQKRVTLAVAYWQAGHSLLEIFLLLLLRLSILHVDINRLLLDRQFCTVAMIRCLQACPWQSIMPVPARSNQLKELKQSARRSQILDYTMRSPTDGEVTFTLHAVCRYARGRRGKHGIDCLLFAVIGPSWHGRPWRLANIYRSRFGIETGYRMMNTVRARTSSRDPKFRLLFVVVAFALINLWLTLKWTVLAVPRRGGRWQQPDLFRLHRFCNFLRDAIREIRCAVLVVVRPHLSHAVF